MQPFEGNGLLKLTATQRLQWVPEGVGEYLSKWVDE
jgi:hypothetical protein